MPRIPDESFSMKCPGCGKSRIHFDEVAPALAVEIESRQTIEVPGMKTLMKTCSNPACKWSRVTPTFPGGHTNESEGEETNSGVSGN